MHCSRNFFSDILWGSLDLQVVGDPSTVDGMAADPSTVDGMAADPSTANGSSTFDCRRQLSLRLQKVAYPLATDGR